MGQWSVSVMENQNLHRNNTEANHFALEQLAARR